MADARFVSDYPALLRHNAERHSGARARRRRLGVALPVVALVVLGGFQVSMELGMFAAAIGAAVLLFVSINAGSSVEPNALIGVEGEVSVLRELRSLPDEYVIFNRVQLPDRWLPNGGRELDFIVAGPGGLFVIEVKNIPGIVYVQPGARDWPVARRAGCGNRPGWNTIVNPVPQVTDQASALKRWLLEHGIHCNPRPIVCFSNRTAGIENAGAAEVPVVTVDGINEELLAGGDAGQPPGGAIQALARLRPAA